MYILPISPNVKNVRISGHISQVYLPTYPHQKTRSNSGYQQYFPAASAQTKISRLRLLWLRLWLHRPRASMPGLWVEPVRLAVLAVVPPEAGRLLGRGGVTTSGGPARSQPKRGNRWLLDRADGHGDFNVTLAGQR